MAILNIGTLRPANRRVATIGDSITYRGSTLASSGAARHLDVGYMSWARVLSRQAVIHTPDDAYGVAGEDSAGLLARLPTVLAANTAGLVVVETGTNDFGASFLTFAQTAANLTAIRDTILAAGRQVVFLTPPPRGDATYPAMALSATYTAVAHRIRQMLLGWRDVPGVSVVDTHAALADPTSSLGYAAALVTTDGLHWSPLGAYRIGRALATLFASLYAPSDLLPASYADIYDATNNPSGALNVNPAMTGTGGSLGSGGTATGSVATGYSNGGTTGLTRTYAKVTTTAADGRALEWQQCTLSGTPSSAIEFNLLSQTLPVASLAIGDRVRIVADVEVDAGASGLRGLFLRLRDNSVLVAADMQASDGLHTMYPAVAWSGVLLTPEWTLTSTAVSLALQGVTVAGQAIAGTVRCRAVRAWKVGV